VLYQSRVLFVVESSCRGDDGAVSRKLLILPPVAVGAIVLFLFVRGREGPERVDVSEIARAVRVITVQPRTIVPSVIAYGTVRPSKHWAAVAEVAGRVAFVSPLLKVGEVIPAGRELIRIDDTDKKLEVARMKAEAAGFRAQLDRLAASGENVKALVAVEERSLALTRRELERLEDLHQRGSISQADVDTQRRLVLGQESAVVNLRNSLRLLPSEGAQLQAQLDATLARLRLAERDVARAVIKAPFPCRVETVNVEMTQSVTVGQTLAETFDVEVAEIEARVAVQQARHLFASARPIEIVEGLTQGVDWSRFGIRATVRLRLSELAFTWEARFARVAPTLSVGTRAAGIVVAVDQPLRNRVAGKPPLINGMFVEVELSGPPRENRIVIPRAAMHAGRVYLADEQNHLVIRPVTVDFRQGEEAVIATGLSAGERLVLSDVIPAIEGMLLDPQAADAAR